MEASLPPNRPRCTDIKFPFSPRPMYPVHIEGININPESDYFETRYMIDLIMVPMETVRKWFKFRSLQTKEARENLQVWINNLGEALFNPMWWRLIHRGNPQKDVQLKSYPVKRGGRYPLRQNPHIERLHGTHRIRALEACDFDFVYTYFQTGVPFRAPTPPEMRLNDKRPTTSTQAGRCEKCRKGIRWHGGRDISKSTWYNCKNCGYHGERPTVYPEPV